MTNTYLNINVKITIAGKIEFSQVKSVEIHQSIETLSDTAKIELPRGFKNTKISGKRISIAEKNILDSIKIGNTIKIQVGYNGQFHTEFQGYITQIGADIPLVIHCEDEMYQLKNKALINETFLSVSLKSLLQKIVPEYDIQTLDTQLGKLMIERSSPYKVLEELQKQYGFRFYFKGKTLFAGFKTDVKSPKIHAFSFNQNFRNSNELKYKTKADRKVLLKAESSQSGSSQKLVYEFGERGFSERTLHAPMNLSLSQLKEFTEKIYKSSVFDGYEGTIESFGLPRTQAGDSIKLTDPNYPDGHRNGMYLLESVTILLNAQDGFKRKNKLSLKLANTFE